MFLTKQATPPTFRDWSDLTRSYFSISSSLFKILLPSLVLLNPVTVAFVSLAMQRISSVLYRRLFTVSLIKCMPLF